MALLLHSPESRILLRAKLNCLACLASPCRACPRQALPCLACLTTPRQSRPTAAAVGLTTYCVLHSKFPSLPCGQIRSQLQFFPVAHLQKCRAVLLAVADTEVAGLVLNLVDLETPCDQHHLTRSERAATFPLPHHAGEVEFRIQGRQSLQHRGHWVAGFVAMVELNVESHLSQMSHFPTDFLQHEKEPA